MVILLHTAPGRICKYYGIWYAICILTALRCCSKMTRKKIMLRCRKHTCNFNLGGIFHEEGSFNTCYTCSSSSSSYNTSISSWDRGYSSSWWQQHSYTFRWWCSCWWFYSSREGYILCNIWSGWAWRCWSLDRWWYRY